MFYCFLSWYCFGICHKRAHDRLLYCHCIFTVGVVQLSRTTQNAFMDTSFFVTVVFPMYQPSLTVKHHAAELYIVYSDYKTTMTTEPLVGSKFTLVTRECQVWCLQWGYCILSYDNAVGSQKHHGMQLQNVWQISPPIVNFLVVSLQCLSLVIFCIHYVSVCWFTLQVLPIGMDMWFIVTQVW